MTQISLSSKLCVNLYKKTINLFCLYSLIIIIKKKKKRVVYPYFSITRQATTLKGLDFSSEKDSWWPTLKLYGYATYIGLGWTLHGDIGLQISQYFWYFFCALRFKSLFFDVIWINKKETSIHLLKKRALITRTNHSNNSFSHKFKGNGSRTILSTIFFSHKQNIPQLLLLAFFLVSGSMFFLWRLSFFFLCLRVGACRNI